MKLSTRLITLFLILFVKFLPAQNYSDLWQEYFSYLDVSSFSVGSNLVYVASENAIFSLDLNTKEIKEITTINGLSGEMISSIYYSEVYNLLMIGYENGLVEVYMIDKNDVLTVIDILDKTTIPPNSKRINHFSENEGVVYISTDFGISVYDLERLEFGDTYFIGFGGSQIPVNQTAVFNNVIYAACGEGNGIKIAGVDNPDLINFNEWTTISNGNFLLLETVGSRLFTINNNRTMYEISGANLNAVRTFPLQPVALKSQDGNLTVTTNAGIRIFDENLTEFVSLTNEGAQGAIFTCATIFQDQILIGTKGNSSLGISGYGLLITSRTNQTEFLEVHPDGPLLNNIFEVATPNNEIWAVFGGYSRTFNPFAAGVRSAGYSHFKEEEWRNTTYAEIANLYTDPLSLSHIAVNPFKDNEVFISSYWSGMLEINEDLPVQLYDKNNSTIVPFLENIYFLSASVFDANGALWVANGQVERPLNKFENGQWTSYDFTSIIDSPRDNLGFYDIAIDRDNTVFLGSYRFGLVAFRLVNGNQELVFAKDEEDGFPTDKVRALAFDNNGQLWIGTERGIRILFNPSNFFEDQQVRNIVILEDGIPKELLENQVISAIEVDGSNNKWVGTADSGAFYFSSDGQQTIYHFTKDNSPLPTNVINDISIDRSTGAVYFATPNGLVAFSSGGSSPEESLESAYVYPNPVRPEYDILGYNDLNNINNGVKIKGITENVNIKITDIEGNLVAEAQSRINQRTSRANYNFAIDGGTAIWNGKNLANNIVATGVYLIMISDLDSFETKVLKLLIVR